MLMKDKLDFNKYGFVYGPDSIDTVLNYIENSIPKETIIEKLNNLELSEELQESWNELDGSTAVTLAYKELLRNK